MLAEATGNGRDAAGNGIPVDVIIASIVGVVADSRSRLDTVGNQRERLAVGSDDMGVWRRGGES